MTLRLVAKWTFSQLSLIQEHDRDPFERTRGAPTRLNFFKFLLGTYIDHTNGTDIESYFCKAVPENLVDIGNEIPNVRITKPFFLIPAKLGKFLKSESRFLFPAPRCTR
ncbi:hypothetical protein TNCV_156321 [Trichonephila clavipes]|nr:hypothetical protein TNCV_156321 [Trichonephila clavipes]